MSCVHSSLRGRPLRAARPRPHHGAAHHGLRGRPLRAARPRPHHHVLQVSHCVVSCVRSSPWPTWSSPSAARPRPHHHVLQVSHCVVSCVRSSPWPTWSSPSCCSTSPPPSRSTSKSLRRVVCSQLTMAYVVVPFVLLDLAPTITFYK